MDKAVWAFAFRKKENKTLYYNERNKPMLNLESLKFMIVHVAYSNVIQKLRHAYFYANQNQICEWFFYLRKILNVWGWWYQIYSNCFGFLSKSNNETFRLDHRKVHRNIPKKDLGIFRGFFRRTGVFFHRYVIGIVLFRRHTDDFFPRYVAVFL